MVANLFMIEQRTMFTLVQLLRTLWPSSTEANANRIILKNYGRRVTIAEQAKPQAVKALWLCLVAFLLPMRDRISITQTVPVAWKQFLGAAKSYFVNSDSRLGIVDNGKEPQLGCKPYLLLHVRHPLRDL